MRSSQRGRARGGKARRGSKRLRIRWQPPGAVLHGGSGDIRPGMPSESQHTAFKSRWRIEHCVISDMVQMAAQFPMMRIIWQRRSALLSSYGLKLALGGVAMEAPAEIIALIQSNFVQLLPEILFHVDFIGVAVVQLQPQLIVTAAGIPEERLVPEVPSLFDFFVLQQMNGETHRPELWAVDMEDRPLPNTFIFDVFECGPRGNGTLMSPMAMLMDQLDLLRGFRHCAHEAERVRAAPPVFVESIGQALPEPATSVFLDAHGIRVRCHAGLVRTLVHRSP